MTENPVEIWRECRNSCSFGLFANDEAGYALAEEGYNENYGCEHSEIVKSGKYKNMEFMETNGSFTEAAILHGFGKDTDEKTINDLKNSCANCKYFQRRI
ncbi:MAG TPA: hypothetical protein VG895_04910 [Patescibacteria group bacterium]|nr:hypothetical protein [Patescibacteria group bacterium]